MVDSGLYQLLLYLPENRQITVGSKGLCNFAAGYYVYTGSAKRNLQARISRHIRRRKKVRWHIDYLTLHSVCLGHRAYLSPQFSECQLHAATLKLTGAAMPVKGFGASDCSCFSHLVYFNLLNSSWRIFDSNFSKLIREL